MKGAELGLFDLALARPGPVETEHHAGRDAPARAYLGCGCDSTPCGADCWKRNKVISVPSSHLGNHFYDYYVYFPILFSYFLTVYCRFLLLSPSIVLFVSSCFVMIVSDNADSSLTLTI